MLVEPIGQVHEQQEAVVLHLPAESGVAAAPDRTEVAWINPRLKPGERRKVITGIPGKTGIVYTLDRQTGEFLWARPTNFQNVVSRIDGATGVVTVNPESLFTKANEEHLICPTTNGGKNWPSWPAAPPTRRPWPSLSPYYPKLRY